MSGETKDNRTPEEISRSLRKLDGMESSSETLQRIQEENEDANRGLGSIIDNEIKRVKAELE